MTFGDIREGVTVGRGVTITGARSLTSEAESGLPDLFEDYLLPFAQVETTFYLGGAAGVDTLALNWLAGRTRAALVVVVPCAVDDQPEPARRAVRHWQEHERLAEVVELKADGLGTAAYHARNRWMVDRSALTVGFPRGDDPASGTWYTLAYAAEGGKARLIVPL